MREWRKHIFDSRGLDLPELIRRRNKTQESLSFFHEQMDKAIKVIERGNDVHRISEYQYPAFRAAFVKRLRHAEDQLQCYLDDLERLARLLEYYQYEIDKIRNSFTPNKAKLP